MPKGKRGGRKSNAARNEGNAKSSPFERLGSSLASRTYDPKGRVGGKDIRGDSANRTGWNSQGGKNNRGNKYNNNNDRGGFSNGGRSNNRGRSNVRADSNVRAGNNFRADSNARAGSNLRAGSNVRDAGHNRAAGNTQVGGNTRGGSNMHGGSNTRGGSNIRAGSNVPGGILNRGGSTARGRSNIRAGSTARGDSKTRGGRKARGISKTRGRSSTRGRSIARGRTPLGVGRDRVKARKATSNPRRLNRKSGKGLGHRNKARRDGVYVPPPRTTRPLTPNATPEPKRPSTFSSLVERQRWVAKYRDWERRECISKGLMSDPNRRTTLAEAITVVGTGQAMCSEYERVTRMVEGDVWKEEGDSSVKDPGTRFRRTADESKMVKKFTRSAAGAAEQQPSDLRPPLVLSRTLDYLFHQVLRKAPSLGGVHLFLWDRTRAVRNDFSIQQLSRIADVKVAIPCLERIARFHLLSLHLLGTPKPPYDTFSAAHEREQLGNTLRSLFDYYDDNRGLYESPNEAEFRSYQIVFGIQGRKQNWIQRLREWGPRISENPGVKAALKLHEAALTNVELQGPGRPRKRLRVTQGNWMRFFRLVASPEVPYLLACMAEVYIPIVRFRAMRAIWKSCRSNRGSRTHESWAIPIHEMREALCFDTDEETEAYLRKTGFGVKIDDEGVLSMNINSFRRTGFGFPEMPSKVHDVVERKRLGRPLPAIIDNLSVAEFEKLHGSDSLFVPETTLANGPTPDIRIAGRSMNTQSSSATEEPSAADRLASLAGNRGPTLADALALAQKGFKNNAEREAAAKALQDASLRNLDIQALTATNAPKRKGSEFLALTRENRFPKKDTKQGTTPPAGKDEKGKAPAGKNEKTQTKAPADAAKMEQSALKKAREEKDRAAEAKKKEEEEKHRSANADKQRQEEELRKARELERQRAEAAAAEARAEQERIERARAEQARAELEAAQRAQEEAERAARAAMEQEQQRSAVLDELAQTSVVQENTGFFDQFIAHLLGPEIDKAYAACVDKELNARLAHLKTRTLMRKFGLKWRSGFWTRRIAQEGKKRRQRLREAHQRRMEHAQQEEAAAEKEKLRSSTQSERSFAHQNGTSMRSDNTVQFSSSMPPPPRPVVNGEGAKQPRHRTSVRGVKRDAATQEDGETKLEDLAPPAKQRPHHNQDTTNSDYFRLLAMGIQPPDDLIPPAREAWEEKRQNGDFRFKRTRKDSIGDTDNATSNAQAHAEGLERPSKRPAHEAEVQQNLNSSTSSSGSSATRSPSVAELQKLVDAAVTEMKETSKWMADERMEVSSIRSSNISSMGEYVREYFSGDKRRYSALSQSRESLLSPSGRKSSSKKPSTPPKYRSRSSKFLPRDQYADVSLYRQQHGRDPTFARESRTPELAPRKYQRLDASGSRQASPPSAGLVAEDKPVARTPTVTFATSAGSPETIDLADGNRNPVATAGSKRTADGSPKMVEPAATKSQLPSANVGHGSGESVNLKTTPAIAAATRLAFNGSPQAASMEPMSKPSRPQGSQSASADSTGATRLEPKSKPAAPPVKKSTNPFALLANDDGEDDGENDSEEDEDDEEQSHVSEEEEFSEGSSRDATQEDDETEEDSEHDDDDEADEPPATWTGKGGTSVEDAIEL